MNKFSKKNKYYKNRKNTKRKFRIKSKIRKYSKRNYKQIKRVIKKLKCVKI